MRRINEPVGLGNVDLDTVYNNHDFFDSVEKLVKRCNNGPLKQFSMSVDSLGKVNLYDFIFD